MHVILVGLPGAGKTTVGRLVAADLGVPFVDVDTAIQDEIGKTIAEIFRDLGEPRFRDIESAAVERLVNASTSSVLAPGGGWAAQPGNLEAVEGRGLCVYLETSPRAAAERVSRGRGEEAERPLIAEGRELSAMTALLMNRERHYSRSEVSVVTDGRSPGEVAAEVAELARIRGAI